jgi:hypothetical protein
MSVSSRDMCVCAFTFQYFFIRKWRQELACISQATLCTCVWWQMQWMHMSYLVHTTVRQRESHNRLYRTQKCTCSPTNKYQWLDPVRFCHHKCCVSHRLLIGAYRAFIRLVSLAYLRILRTRIPPVNPQFLMQEVGHTIMNERGRPQWNLYF